MILPKFNSSNLNSSSIESMIPKEKYKLNLNDYSNFIMEMFNGEYIKESLSLYVMNQHLLSQNAKILDEIEEIIFSMDGMNESEIDSKLDSIESVFRNYLYEITIYLNSLNFDKTDAFAKNKLDESKILSLTSGKIIMLWEVDWKEGNSIHEIEDFMCYLLDDFKTGYFEVKEIMRS